MLNGSRVNNQPRLRQTNKYLRLYPVVYWLKYTPFYIILKYLVQKKYVIMRKFFAFFQQSLIRIIDIAYTNFSSSGPGYVAAPRPWAGPHPEVTLVQ